MPTPRTTLRPSSRHRSTTTIWNTTRGRTSIFTPQAQAPLHQITPLHQIILLRQRRQSSLVICPTGIYNNQLIMLTSKRRHLQQRLKRNLWLRTPLTPTKLSAEAVPPIGPSPNCRYLPRATFRQRSTTLCTTRLNFTHAPFPPSI